MNLQLVCLLWLIIGAVSGGVLARVTLGARPRDWAPSLFLGALGASLVGFIVRASLAAATIPWSDEASIAASVAGGVIGSGALVWTERRRVSSRR